MLPAAAVCLAGYGADGDSVSNDGTCTGCKEGFYQVAYGHRRVRATAILGIKVRAIVRDLTDAELVIAQGQENNARQDLSFI